MSQIISPSSLHIQIPADLQNLEALGKQVRQLLSTIPDLAEPEITCYNVELVIQEIASNIVRHAYAGQKGELSLSATLIENPRHIALRFEDFGQPFNPDTVQEPRLGELQEHGFGLFLVRQLVEKLEYQRMGKKNVWYLVMNLP